MLSTTKVILRTRRLVFVLTKDPVNNPGYISFLVIFQAKLSCRNSDAAMFEFFAHNEREIARNGE